MDRHFDKRGVAENAALYLVLTEDELIHYINESGNQKLIIYIEIVKEDGGGEIE